MRHFDLWPLPLQCMCNRIIWLRVTAYFSTKKVNRGLIPAAAGQMVCADHRHWQSRTCGECGDRYMGTKRRRKYYCPDCSPALKSDLHWHQCRGCEQWLCRRDQRYCADDCRPDPKPTKSFVSGKRKCPCGTDLLRWRRRCGSCWPEFIAECTRQARRKQGAGTHRARAVRFGVFYEPVDRLKVFRRDKWICGICKTRIDPKLKYPDPRSATLDHIIPLSVCADLPIGPEHGHSYQNTQAAHWDCNCIIKGAGATGEQLALIA